MSIIYLITNNVNGKRYVGQTRKTMEARFRRHKYHSVKPGTHLHRAIHKHGIENFKVELIEETDHPNERERHWIKVLMPEYNMTEGGEGGRITNTVNYFEALRNRRSYVGTGNPMFGRKRDLSKMQAIGQPLAWEANKCPVICEGSRYESVGDAQKAYPGCNIRKRLNSERYPDFYRLRERTRRK